MLSPHRFFLWSLIAGLLLSSFGSNQVVAQEELEEPQPQQRRQLWDFFSFVSLLARLGPSPCRHLDGTWKDPSDWGPESGPIYKRCTTEYGTEQATTGYDTTGEDTSAQTSDSAAYSSYVEAEDGNGDTAQFQGQDTAGGDGFANAAAGFQLWMVFAAGSVLSALVAVHLGQKKPRLAGGKHQMSGSVVRRKGAVSAFADGAFSSEGKDVEMQAPRAEYKLDVGPEGEMA